MSEKQNIDKNFQISRRDLLRYGVGGAASLAFGDMMVWPSWGQTTPVNPKAKAKAVIQIWMWGGPCHLDTFDPKPDAGQDYTGPLNNPVATNVSGVRICELLPELAKMADKYAIIRSMTHRSNAHETASYIVQTGRMPGGMVFPGVGAVVSLFKGGKTGAMGLLPPYLVLTELQGRFSEAGFLGNKAKPFATGGDPAAAKFLVEGVVAEGITEQHQRDRRDLLHNIDTLRNAMKTDAQIASMTKCEEQAYDMILGDSGKVFDLTQEKDDLRTRYGKNTFGQSCLMARRLVERGVPFVTINYKGWDTHKQHFQIMRRKLPELDKGMSTLLADLSDRGLLDSTIIWWSGEFGRTPRVQWEPPWDGGRGHWGNCFNTVVAGGGFKGGVVVGSSDERGEEVKDRPVYPCDLIRAMMEQLGIDPEAPLPHPQGLNVHVCPSASDGIKSGGRLTELI